MKNRYLYLINEVLKKYCFERSKEQMDKYHNAMHNLCEFIVKAAKRGAFTEDEMPDILNFYDTVYNGRKSFGE